MKDCYYLIIIDKNLLSNKDRKINKKTELSPPTSQQYYKQINFDIIWIANPNFIPIIPWLIL